ncbi:MAG TPA: hypothetical protein VHD84_01825 [Candidatus Saccharimonadales bacterium]|nr:hypothetical protein [Candidatus Saccharimonadales bacterium]
MGQSVSYQERVERIKSFCGEEDCPVLQIRGLADRRVAMSGLWNASPECEGARLSRSKTIITDEEGVETTAITVSGVTECPLVQEEIAKRERARTAKMARAIIKDLK